MNTFVKIMYFVFVANAATMPAYNYHIPQQPLSSSTSVNNSVLYTQQSQQLSSFNVSSKQKYVSSNAAQYAPQSQYVSSVPQYTVPTSGSGVQDSVGPAQQYVAPVQHHGILASGAPVISSSQSHYQKPQRQVIVNKEIFIHSAPEETELIGEQGDAAEGTAPIRKNYRIVFIRAPVQNVQLNLESLKRAQAANEEKTVIYVLSKKPDLANIQSQLINVQNEKSTSKPEVFFIKYKTQEEANRAQQEIQAQYDALGGSTRISDEGIHPITSVIGGTSALVGNSVGSVGPSFVSSGSIVGNSGGFGFAADNSANFGSIISPRTSSGGSNFVQTVSSNQEQFVQKSTETTASFSAGAPSSKYLPVTKKN